MENFDELVTDRSIRLADVDAHLKHDDGDRMFQGRYVALSTSGSTGLRGVFLFDTREWIECLASITRPMKWAGIAPNPLRRVRSAMLASATPWHYSARIGRALATRMLPTLRLDAGDPVDRKRIPQYCGNWRKSRCPAGCALRRSIAQRARKCSRRRHAGACWKHGAYESSKRTAPRSTRRLQPSVPPDAGIFLRMARSLKASMSAAGPCRRVFLAIGFC